jgi:hypothetical protein
MTRRSPNPWSPSTPSSVNVPLLPEGAVQVTSSGRYANEPRIDPAPHLERQLVGFTADSLRTLIPPT